MYTDEIITEFTSAWLKNLRFQRRYSEETQRAYAQDMHAFFQFLHEHTGAFVTREVLENIDLRTLRAWLANRQMQEKAKTSTARAISVVRQFYRYFTRHFKVRVAAIEHIRAPKRPEQLPRPLSLDQILELLAHIDQHHPHAWVRARDRALFMLLYASGMRIREALSLTGRDLPLTNQLSIVGKGHKARIIPLLPQLRESIETYLNLCPFSLDEARPLFIGIRGKAMSAQMAANILRQYRRHLGFPESASPHALRHSCATHLMENSHDIRAVQELLGHASLSSTQIYTKVSTKELMNVFQSTHPRAHKSPQKSSHNSDEHKDA